MSQKGKALMELFLEHLKKVLSDSKELETQFLIGEMLGQVRTQWPKLVVCNSELKHAFAQGHPSTALVFWLSEGSASHLRFTAYL